MGVVAAAAQVNCLPAADCDWGVAGGVHRSRLRQRGIEAINAKCEAGYTQGGSTLGAWHSCGRVSHCLSLW